MCRRMCAVFLLLAMLLTPQAAFAWGDTGHMVVAYIAYERLHPKAAARVDELVKWIAAKYTFTDEKIPAFDACAFEFEINASVSSSSTKN